MSQFVQLSGYNYNKPTIMIEKEKIKIKFYKQYKDIREDLIKDIEENNYSKKDNFPEVMEKAEKIMDRIVLSCFFENYGLLPANKFREVGKIEDWSAMKDFFNIIDENAEKIGIPSGYYRELFKNDKKLDNLIISNDICKRFVDLSKYDFEEDLSVNILGHIFEHFLTDLEGVESFSSYKMAQEENNEKQRRREGIYYAPEYIVDYIATNSLGKYLKEREEEILNKYNVDDEEKIEEAYKEYLKILKKKLKSLTLLVVLEHFLLEFMTFY